MTHVLGDATHIKGKPLSGAPQSGDIWVFDGDRYIPASAGEAAGGNDAYAFIEAGGEAIAASDPADTIHLSGLSGVAVTAISGVGVDPSYVTVEVTQLAMDQLPATADLSGLFGFVMASGDGLAVTVPTPISGRVLKASGVNPLTDLYWAVDQTGSGSTGSGSAYAFISAQGSTTLDANAGDDTLNLSGRSGILLTASSGSGVGEDTVFYEVSGLSSDQIPAWSAISGMASAAAGHEEMLRQLENTLSMLTWDIYSEDKTFSDIAVDDYENNGGIDETASTYVYNSEGSFCGPILPDEDLTCDIDIGQSSDLERSDLFAGATIYWQRTSEGKGCFSSDADGTERKTVKLPGADYPDVAEGVAVEISGAVYTIRGIADDGDQDDGVELNGDPTDASVIDGAYGAVVDSNPSALKVNEDVLEIVYGYDDHSSDYGVVTDLTVFNETIVPAGAYITKVGLYTMSEITGAKVKLFTENDTNFDVSDMAVGLSHDGNGYEEWVLDPPFTVPLSGAHHVGVYCGSGDAYYVYEENSPRIQGRYQSGDVTGQNQPFNTADMDRGYGIMVTYTRHFTASELYATATSDAAQKSASLWTEISHVSVAESVPGAAMSVYAASLNKGAQDEQWWIIPDPLTTASYPCDKVWVYDAAGDSVRNVVKASAASYGGSFVRVTLKAPDNWDLVLDHVSIGVRSGETANCESTPTEIFFNQGPGCFIPAGQSETSDWTAFDFDDSVDHLVVMDYADQTTAIAYTENTDGFYWTGYPYDGYNQAVVPPHTLIEGTAILTTIEVNDWRGVARSQSGVWQYMGSGGAYEDAIDNSRLGALRQAFESTDNHMSGSGLAEVEAAQWGALLEDSTNNDTLDFAFGLQADGDNIPEVDNITVTYRQQSQDMELVANSWEASADNPVEAYCVMRIEPMEPITPDVDLQAHVSMNDGADYEPISGLSVIRELGDHELVRGDVSGLTPRDDKTMRLKITTHNNKNIRLHATTLGVRYT